MFDGGFREWQVRRCGKRVKGGDGKDISGRKAAGGRNSS
jgi:hypothetical protein